MFVKGTDLGICKTHLHKMYIPMHNLKLTFVSVCADLRASLPAGYRCLPLIPQKKCCQFSGVKLQASTNSIWTSKVCMDSLGPEK